MVTDVAVSTKDLDRAVVYAGDLRGILGALLRAFLQLGPHELRLRREVRRHLFAAVARGQQRLEDLPQPRRLEDRRRHVRARPRDPLGRGEHRLEQQRLRVAPTTVGKPCPIDAPKVKGKYETADASAHVTWCDACLEGVEKAGVPVKYDETRFVFSFETDGSLTARQALLKALSILKGRVETFESLAGQLAPAARAEA